MNWFKVKQPWGEVWIWDPTSGFRGGVKLALIVFALVFIVKVVFL